MALDISGMEACGVRQCRPSAAAASVKGDADKAEVDSTWMCVTVRFPMLPGLKMPEDEVIDIKCKPQDHAVAGSNVINFQENEWVQTVFKSSILFRTFFSELVMDMFGIVRGLP